MLRYSYNANLFAVDEPYLKTEPSMTSIAPAPQTQQHNEDYKSCWRSMEAQLTAIKATYDNNVKELERIHKEEIEGVKSIQNMVLASMKEHYETQLESEKKKNKKGWGDTSLWAALFVLAGTLYVQDRSVRCMLICATDITDQQYSNRQPRRPRSLIKPLISRRWRRIADSYLMKKSGMPRPLATP
jgi:hypothetical protein